MTTQLEFKVRDNRKKYKVQGIWDIVVYTKKLEDYLPSLYYLVSWKNCFKKKNT